MERPASPAAHTTKQASNLADESRAIRGRVHAVVDRVPQGSRQLAHEQVQLAYI